MPNSYCMHDSKDETLFKDTRFLMALLLLSVLLSFMVNTFSHI